MSRTLTPFQSIAFSDGVGIISIIGAAFVATLTYFLYAFDGFVIDVTPVGTGTAIFGLYFGIRYFRRSHRVMAKIQSRPIRRSTVATRMSISALFVMSGFTGGCTFVAYLLNTRGYSVVSTAAVEVWALAFSMAFVAGTVMFFLVERSILSRLARTQAKLVAEVIA